MAEKHRQRVYQLQQSQRHHAGGHAEAQLKARVGVQHQAVRRQGHVAGTAGHGPIKGQGGLGQAAGRIGGFAVGQPRADGVYPVDAPAAQQAEGIGGDGVGRPAEPVEHPVKGPAGQLLAAGADAHHVVAQKRRLVGLPDQRRVVAQVGCVKLIHKIADGTVLPGVHAQLHPLRQAHVQQGQGLGQGSGGKVPHSLGGAIGAAVVHGDQLILGEVLLQLGAHRLQKRLHPGRVVAQVHHRRDKIALFCLGHVTIPRPNRIRC